MLNDDNKKKVFTKSLVSLPFYLFLNLIFCVAEKFFVSLLEEKQTMLHSASSKNWIV